MDVNNAKIFIERFVVGFSILALSNLFVLAVYLYCYFNNKAKDEFLIEGIFKAPENLSSEQTDRDYHEPHFLGALVRHHE